MNNKKTYFNEYRSKLHPLLKVIGMKNELPRHHHNLIRSDSISRYFCHCGEYRDETVQDKFVVVLFESVAHSG